MRRAVHMTGAKISTRAPALADSGIAAHRQREIRLTVENACGYGDGDFGNELANENNAAPPGLRGFFAHIKAQIHFFEIAMSRDGQSAHDSVIKEEADNAEISLTVVEVELGTGGHMRREDFPIDGKVQHGEVAPVRGQKRF